MLRPLARLDRFPNKKLPGQLPVAAEERDGRLVLLGVFHTQPSDEQVELAPSGPVPIYLIFGKRPAEHMRRVE